MIKTETKERSMLDVTEVNPISTYVVNVLARNIRLFVRENT